MLLFAAVLLWSSLLAHAKVPWLKHPVKHASVSFERDVTRHGRHIGRATHRVVHRRSHLHRRQVPPSGKHNVWKPLSTEEAASVVALLHNDPSLNLTATQSAGAWDNSINVVDVLYPNKDAALAYLDGDGSEPERFAKAVIYFQANNEPYAQEFRIGPLPVNDRTTISPLVYPSSNSSTIRIYDADFEAINDFARAEVTSMVDIVEDLLGAPPQDFAFFGTDPLPDSEGRATCWLGFWGRPETDDAVTLSPQGLQMHFDFTGRDPAGWRFEGWFWNGAFFDSHEAFRKAWSEPGFEKPTRNNAMNSTWISPNRQGVSHPLDLLAPPMQVRPDEQRFTVDQAENLIEWQDWKFYVSFSRSTGLRLFDVHFRERILFELGLDEAIAHYAGADPIQSSTAYLDSFYGFGRFAMSMVPGFDCPTHALFLNTTSHQNERSTTHTDSICIFETDADHLLQRHTSDFDLSVTKNVVLVVRSVSTIGNYDYTFDYRFYLDGSLEVQVRASGYIQAAFWAKNGDHGYKIGDGLSGSQHEHVLTWKADFDIKGKSNTFYRHSVVSDTIKYSWSKASLNTMRLQKDKVTTEDEGRQTYGANGDSMFFVGNADELNAFGEVPGYAFKPSLGGGAKVLTIQDSPVLARSGSFATSPIIAAVQRDEEPTAAHFLSTLDPANPIIQFDKYLNGENLEQKDLVLWLNLGMTHVPNTADLPNTVMTTAQAGLMFSPHNMFASDASRSTHQMARITFDPQTDGVAAVNTFESTFATGSVNLDTFAPDLGAYQVESVTRKFPYEPLDADDEVGGMGRPADDAETAGEEGEAGGAPGDTDEDSDQALISDFVD
ncbi:hypothetical protein OIV83_003806 [Microbotryomycetes sp. JL201]|nr:hypothetical protein OIV83_003806 [Microbotryomycetes sp. JL201]